MRPHDSTPLRSAASPRAQCGHRRAPFPTQAKAAFTRSELAAVLAALVLLGTLAIPLLAGNRDQSLQTVCLNNLRQVGAALNSWAGSHQSRYPARVPASQGGLQGAASGLQNNVWFQFLWISNELVTPSLLVCPEDARAKVARDWSAHPQTGMLNPSFRDNAVSYTLGLDAFPAYPLSVLSTDGHLVTNGTSTGCSSGIMTALGVDVPPAPGKDLWTPSLHGGSGQVVLADGRAIPTTSASLRRLINQQFFELEKPTLHLLMRH